MSGVVLAFMAIASGIVTYAVLFDTEEPPQSFLDVPTFVIVLDLSVVILLSIAIVGKAFTIWQGNRDGKSGAHLHMRLALLLAGVSIVPATLISIFSVLFFDLRIEGWFSGRAQIAVAESVAVAESLVEEHRATIRADVLAMANDLNSSANRLQGQPTLLRRVLTQQSGARGLSEAVIFDKSGQIIARSSFSIGSSIEQISLAAIDRAEQGGVQILRAGEGGASQVAEDTVSALIKLEGFIGPYPVYLFVNRFVAASIVSQVQKAQQVSADFKAVADRRFSYSITFIGIFVVVVVLLVLSSVWLSLTFSTRLSQRLGRVVFAAEEIRDGSLSTRIRPSGEDDEIEMLGHTFNAMAQQIESQRAELLSANHELDIRHRLLETVLSGVTAGVIGLDSQGRIDLHNRAAKGMVGPHLNRQDRPHLSEVIPEMSDLIEQSMARPQRVAESEISLQIDDGDPVTLFVRVSAEQSDDGVVLGYVVTFDDISDLVSAQRMAVWADVARRIAHEIRNPLTPIQLSAERLKRKYLKEVQSDPDVFLQCTDTIIRRVGDIGRMVDEFSSFARMPAPEFQEEDLSALVRESIFSEKVAHSNLTYEFSESGDPRSIMCDKRQFRQVMTNVLKNAAEAIERHDSREDDGTIDVNLAWSHDVATITVEDNGIGLPKAERGRLTEPYVTTREKGTGLGLAIVRKIVEDHDGAISLNDATNGGAAITMTFPVRA